MKTKPFRCQDKPPRAWHKTKKRMYSVFALDWTYVRDKIMLVRVRVFQDEIKDFRTFKPANLILLWPIGLKDKNGTEIYEGDVVQWGNEEGLYSDQINKMEIVSDRFYALTKNAHLCEIIGNIFQNKELLNDTKKTKTNLLNTLSLSKGKQGSP